MIATVSILLADNSASASVCRTLSRGTGGGRIALSGCCHSCVGSIKMQMHHAKASPLGSRIHSTSHASWLGSRLGYNGRNAPRVRTQRQQPGIARRQPASCRSQARDRSPAPPQDIEGPSTDPSVIYGRLVKVRSHVVTTWLALEGASHTCLAGEHILPATLPHDATTPCSWPCRTGWRVLVHAGNWPAWWASP